MKLFLFILLLMPAGLWAQDSTAIACKLNTETDPFTKEIKLSTGFISLRGGSVTIDATKPEVDLLFALQGNEICFDNNSTAFLYFEGSKTKITVRNGGTMNCEGLFHFIFKNTETTATNLTKLSTLKLSRIVFTTTTKAELTVSLNADMQNQFMQLTKCLTEEAKRLIK